MDPQNSHGGLSGSQLLIDCRAVVPSRRFSELVQQLLGGSIVTPGDEVHCLRGP